MTGSGPTTTPAATAPTLRFIDVRKEYALGDDTLRALDRLPLEVRRGEFVAVVGRSGLGKSTVLHLAAGIDVPTRGEHGQELPFTSQRVHPRPRSSPRGGSPAAAAT